MFHYDRLSRLQQLNSNGDTVILSNVRKHICRIQQKLCSNGSLSNIYNCESMANHSSLHR